MKEIKPEVTGKLVYEDLDISKLIAFFRNFGL